MAEITAKQVQELREKTGAGMMDCKKALTEAGGDSAKAEEVLRKKGLAAAAKKSSRAATEGAVASYIHMGGSTPLPRGAADLSSPRLRCPAAGSSGSSDTCTPRPLQHSQVTENASSSPEPTRLRVICTRPRDVTSAT